MKKLVLLFSASIAILTSCKDQSNSNDDSTMIKIRQEGNILADIHKDDLKDFKYES